jgi:dihydroorotate dehydrogenase
MITYENIKKVLFNFEPETAHHIAECSLRLASNCPLILNKFIEENFVTNNVIKQELFNSTFHNPVGIGAGFDKNATMIRGMMALGFGYTEVGTVTPKPQSGNEKPRLKRLVQIRSLQNAMGFNNDGSFKVQQRLKDIYPYSMPIGMNIGKNKTTSEADAIDDYEKLIRTFKDFCDYLVINISSPNTPNLRDLQNEEFIKILFDKALSLTDKPILLKIAPDMSIDNAINLSNTAINSGAKGIIATNTTIDYSCVDEHMLNVNGLGQRGGLSGEVVREKSYQLFKELAKEVFDKTTLISVGGIDSADEAYKRIKAGASLIQTYSPFIFQGPKLIKDINTGMTELIKKDGFNHISQAIGSDLKS